MRSSTLLVMIGLAVLIGSNVTADVFMKQVTHTGEMQMMGHTQPEKTDTASIGLAKDMAAMISPEGHVIFRADKDSMYVLDPAQKTYQAMALATVREMSKAAGTMGEEMSKAMEGMSEEDKAQMKKVMEKLKDNPQMKEMADKMMGNASGSASGESAGEAEPFMTVKVTPTDETKTINGWDTKKYTATMKMMMGTGTMEIWAAPSLQIDADMYNTLQASMMVGSNGFDDLVAEMKKIDGVPVYSVHKVDMMGTTIESTMQLLEFKGDASAPAEVFTIPADYTQVEIPEMGGMGGH
jgi:hypothetical protein